MSQIRSILAAMGDNAAVLMQLPAGQGFSSRLHGVFKQTDPPAFQLLFPAGLLAQHALAADTLCQISVSDMTRAEAFSARIARVVDGCTLDMIGLETIRPELLRDYFRVTVRSPITAWYRYEHNPAAGPSWSLAGETVDLSGSGVLAMFAEEPHHRRQIALTLDLPELEPLSCTADVVRMEKVRKNRHRVAFHFTKLEQKLRDRIIKYCLKMERKQLRDNIRVA